VEPENTGEERQRERERQRDRPMSDDVLRWTVLIPLKALPAAKSRLAQSLLPHQHVEVVEAIRADTIAAALDAQLVARVVVVADVAALPHAPGVVTIVQTAPGLNSGLAEVWAQAACEWPGDGIASLVGDLPALQPMELDAALTEASEHPRSFVPDAAGVGTTLLAARPGVDLAPEYGVGSAARHRASAVELAAGPGLRADVDTAEELEQARKIGVGRHTRAVLETFTDTTHT
jgi:2-phospho-L-lactate/phosphoenolpyruvate guanylyltransferase